MSHSRGARLIKFVHVLSDEATSGSAMLQPPPLAKNCVAPGILCCTIVHTQLGWLAVVGRSELVDLITIGHPTRQAALEEVSRRLAANGDAHIHLHQTDWFPELRERLQQYVAGRPVAFDDVKLNWTGLSEFSRNVLQQVRNIPYGETRTYGQIARAVGRPGAARAVGQVMAHNRWPIVVPCHRVVASSGDLRGFSAPQGIRLKRRMLELERVRVGAVIPTGNSDD